MSNAIRYNVEGGAVRVRGHCEDDDLLIIVEDTGVGIPAGFDTAHVSDAGLGLAIVRARV